MKQDQGLPVPLLPIITEASLARSISIAKEAPVRESDTDVNQNLRNAMFHLSGWLRGGYGPCTITGDQLERFITAILYPSREKERYE